MINISKTPHVVSLQLQIVEMQALKQRSLHVSRHLTLSNKKPCRILLQNQKAFSITTICL